MSVHLYQHNYSVNTCHMSNCLMGAYLLEYSFKIWSFKCICHCLSKDFMYRYNVVLSSPSLPFACSNLPLVSSLLNTSISSSPKTMCPLIESTKCCHILGQSLLEPDQLPQELYPSRKLTFLLIFVCFSAKTQ